MTESPDNVVREDAMTRVFLAAYGIRGGER